MEPGCWYAWFRVWYPPCERLPRAVYRKLYVTCAQLSPVGCKLIQIAAILGHECRLISLKHRTNYDATSIKVVACEPRGILVHVY